MKKGCALALSLIFAIIVLIISAVLLGVSFGDVSLRTSAIKIQSISKQIEAGIVYQPGKYYINPQYKFIDYSTQWTWITFGAGGDSAAINSKTSNPSNVYLEVAILYRIREEYLHEIYKKWPTKSNQRDYVLFAKDAIQKVPEDYSNNDFFTQREKIEQVMGSKVNQVFRSNYAEVIAFLITDVQLDNTFEASIENQQSSKRAAETAIQQQVIDVLQGQISVIQSQYASKVAQISADTSKQIKIINEVANSNSQSRIIEAEVSLIISQKSQRIGYSAIKSQNSFSPAQILQYKYYRKVFVTPSGGVSVGT
ncbi:UNKNOWN [Stylonychia lemnae]|uniref:Band 7 domain-containing protein n=1 Tax=Stylonychia lemnae TaxID=5949 RepID=A0A078AS57_STYLE|nr:UNKNOWN [Stylonychia lemnae]|eukprot:CDW84052.1 UNKNOWN [Stylonychia lemnae]